MAQSKEYGLDLMNEIKAMGQSLIASLNNNDEVERVSVGLSDLISQSLVELLEELKEQANKILSAIASSQSVINTLLGLLASLQELDAFLLVFSKTSLIFLNKSRLKRKCLLLQHNIRAKGTQLLGIVTLALLSLPNTRKGGGGILGTGTYTSLNDGSGEPTTYSIGNMYYYGINRPKNVQLAFAKFLEAAESGDDNAMVATAKCYINGHGIEQNVQVAKTWLTKAATTAASSSTNNSGSSTNTTLGNPAAKTELAALLITNVQSSSSEAQMKIFLQTKLPVSPVTGRSSAPRVGRDRDGGEEKGVRNTEAASSSSFNLNPKSTKAAIKNISIKATIDNDDEDVGDENEVEGEDKEEFVEHDQQLQEATRLLLDAASQGYTEAQSKLGDLFQLGDDFEQAATW